MQTRARDLYVFIVRLDGNVETKSRCHGNNFYFPSPRGKKMDTGLNKIKFRFDQKKGNKRLILL